MAERTGGARVRQFAGHWYSGRAARLCAVEALLVALSLWVTGRQAAGNLPALAALKAALNDSNSYVVRVAEHALEPFGKG